MTHRTPRLPAHGMLILLLAGCAAPPPRPPAQTSAVAPPAQPSASSPTPSSDDSPAAPAGQSPSTPPITPAPTPAPPPDEPTKPVVRPAFREIFPLVRADTAARVVEFDGLICADTTHPQTPVVYLEVLACRPDSREHESLVVSPAMPSHVHAALLLAGLEPGRPGSWSFEGNTLKSSPPTGPRLRIRLEWMQGDRLFRRDLTEFVRHAQTSARLTDDPASGFVFAGSAFVRREGREVYAADLSGTIIGLCAFGDEPIAWSVMMSPEASLEDPVWIADGERLPRPGTPVVVRIEPVDPPKRPAGPASPPG